MAECEPACGCPVEYGGDFVRVQSKNPTRGGDDPSITGGSPGLETPNPFVSRDPKKDHK